MTDTNTPKPDEKMIDRVRKLFAMSQDTSSLNEAAIALKRCMSLMNKYGITEADLTTSEFGTDSSFAGKRLDKWRSYMAVGIARFTETVVSIAWDRDVNGARIKKIVYKGFDADVQNAILLTDYLEHTLERCLNTYKKETGNTGKAAATSFRNGFALALQERMSDMADERAYEAQQSADAGETSNGTSLVVQKMKLVESEFGRQKISRSSSRVSDGGATYAGNQAGQKVNLNRQVSGNGQKALNAA